MELASDDYLRLIQSENVGHDPNANLRPVRSNPFVLPDDGDIFGAREFERRRRSVARSSLMGTSLIQRTDLLRPPIPPCIIQRHSVLAPTPPIVVPRRGADQMERSKRITDFLREKRQMYLLQLMIDGQLVDMEEIRKTMSESEREILEEEATINRLSREYKQTQNENEANVNRGFRQREFAIQRRAELQGDLRRATTNVAAEKSLISNRLEILEDYKLYQEFLKSITPEGLCHSDHFDHSDKLVDYLDEMERYNLGLIQACQQTEEKLAVADADTALEFAIADEAAKLAAEHMDKVPAAPAELPGITEKTVSHGKALEATCDKLEKAVQVCYLKCFPRAGICATMAMLERIENTFEQFYRQLALIQPAFIAKKQAQQIKHHREVQRQLKQEKEEAEQRLKIEQAIYRSTRPVHKHEGRPLMPRSQPFRANSGEDHALMAQLKEQRRVDELLFGEIT
jgi:hypothetical protein